MHNLHISRAHIWPCVCLHVHVHVQMYILMTLIPPGGGGGGGSHSGPSAGEPIRGGGTGSPFEEDMTREAESPQLAALLKTPPPDRSQPKIHLTTCPNQSRYNDPLPQSDRIEGAAQRPTDKDGGEKGGEFVCFVFRKFPWQLKKANYIVNALTLFLKSTNFQLILVICFRLIFKFPQYY